MISFIVSVYDRPENLPLIHEVLWNQREIEREVIVCDNGGRALEGRMEYYEQVLPTGVWGARSCYESANMVCERGIPKGDWLCFPSDDSLYVQDFSRIMLATAERTGAELVYCDCVYKQGSVNGSWPAYSVLDVSPKMGRIDKTCFILRRSRFKGFPEHPQDYRDGALIESLIAEGIRHAKAPGVLVVHQ